MKWHYFIIGLQYSGYTLQDETQWSRINIEIHCGQEVLDNTISDNFFTYFIIFSTLFIRFIIMGDFLHLLFLPYLSVQY
jgi:hypothetical protein